MNDRRLSGLRRILAMAVVVAALAGCTVANGGAAPVQDAAETTAAVAPAAETALVVAGAVTPARAVTLRAAVTGALTEVPETEGGAVSAGTLLAQIDPTDAELGVRRAEAGLAAAEARLAQAQEGARPAEIAAAAAQVELADATVAQAAAQRDAVTAGLAAADALAAQAGLLEAEIAHDAADEAHEDTMTCYEVPTPDGGTREICPTLGTLEEMARAQRDAAYAGILAAQAQLDMVTARDAPTTASAQAGVQAALAQRAAAAAQLALAEAGARAEAVAVAERGVAQAETAVAQARERLAQHRITAPFDGVLTHLPVAAGDTVAPGTALATVATLDRLEVRTTDLTELDLDRVRVGQAVAVTLDAMPAAPLRGTVRRIEPQGTPLFGDVLYDAVILLDEVPAWVRWGMTAEITLDGAAPDGAAAGPPSPSTVIVEGVAAPERSAGLQVVAGGEVAALPVVAGDRVAAGEVVAQLDDAHQRLAVAAAEAALATAEADLALASTGARPEAVAAAEADLAAAEAALWQAVAARDELQAGVAGAEVAGVRAQLEQARAQRRQLEAALLWAEGDEDDERAADVRDQMRAVDVAIAGHAARLDALPVAYDARLRAANAGISAAMAQVAAAEAALDLVLAAPTDATMAVAEAAVQQAAVDLAAAEVALARTRVTAPFAGTLTRVMIEVGDTVAPGQPIAVLGDLDQLRVETTDLTEIDVIAVQAGLPVRLTVDALPGQSWTGQVRRIRPERVIVGSDVTYPTIIDLDDPIPGLLWGMTVAVTIGP